MSVQTSIATRLVALLLFLAPAATVGQSLRWESLGGPPGGEIQGIHLGRDSVLYVSAFDTGILFTEDDGATWHSLRDTSRTRQHILPFAATTSGERFVGHLGGLIRHAGGRAWTRVGTMEGFTAIASAADGSLHAAIGGGLFHSTDAGETWSNYYSSGSIGRPQELVVLDDGTALVPLGVRGLLRTNATAPETSQYLTDRYIQTLAASGRAVLAASTTALALSLDGGLTFAPVELERAGGLDVVHVALRTLSNGRLMIAVVGRDSNRVFHAIASSDGGATWPDEWTALGPRDVLALEINHTGTAYIGTRNGLLRSTDTGRSWNPEPTPTSVVRIVGVPKPGLVITRASQGSESAAYRSTDEGGTWDTVSAGEYDELTAGIILRDDRSLLAGSIDGLLVSTDDGATWSALDTIDDDIIDLDAFGSTVLSIHRRVSEWAQSVLRRSTDGGMTWDAGRVLPRELGMVSLVERTGGGDLIAGANVGLWRSTDDGATWSATGPAPERAVYRLDVSDAGVHVVTLSDTGTFISRDDGSTWEQLVIGSDSAFVLASILPDERVVVATADGRMYGSTDRGVTWSGFGAGLERYYPTGLGVAPDGGIYLGTYGGGVFRLVEGPTSAIDRPLRPIPLLLDLW